MHNKRLNGLPLHIPAQLNRGSEDSKTRKALHLINLPPVFLEFWTTSIEPFGKITTRKRTGVLLNVFQGKLRLIAYIANTTNLNGKLDQEVC